mmetsp:Transcript_20901/g.23872  ORF Transcript_20901/g.23872 Transcript_20901/m.23872 type:complete len:231 (+) Transcript_20901:57-749(+)
MSNKHQNRRRRGRENSNDPQIKTSKTLTWVLRHSAPSLGLEIGQDGYIQLDQLLQHSHPKLRSLKEDIIREVVISNDKQRFALIEKDDGIWYIRANQGHSIESIDPYQLLTPIDPEKLKTLTLLHGTYFDPWSKHISTEGLSKMSRNHIHFAKGMPSENGVISGMRKSCDIYIYMDATKCSETGIQFFESTNGVLLTAGVENTGMLPSEYISHVVSKTNEIILDQRYSSS